MAVAAVRWGSASASMRALALRYCFFCSSDPVSASIHLAVMSVLLACGVQFSDALCEEGPGPPELGELLLALRVQGEHLARRPLLTGHLLDIDQALLLDAHEQR